MILSRIAFALRHIPRGFAVVALAIPLGIACPAAAHQDGAGATTGGSMTRNPGLYTKLMTIGTVQAKWIDRQKFESTLAAGEKDPDMFLRIFNRPQGILLAATAFELGGFGPFFEAMRKPGTAVPLGTRPIQVTFQLKSDQYSSQSVRPTFTFRATGAAGAGR